MLCPPGALYETSYSLQSATKNNCHKTERTHVPRRSCFRSTNQEYDSAMAIHIDSVEYNLISFTSWDGRGTLWICLNKHGSILKQRILLRSDTRTNIGLSRKSISLLNTTQIKRAYCWSMIPEYLDYLNQWFIHWPKGIWLPFDNRINIRVYPNRIYCCCKCMIPE